MSDEDNFCRLARGLRAVKAKFGTRYKQNNEILVDDIPLKEANLLTSRHQFGRDKCDKGMHRVVIDIDYDAALIPSSSPDHYHLILDRVLPWHQYVELLNALAKAGIIEKGYAEASINRGYTAIRPPWEKK